jgi:hypothetical protein
MRNLNWYRRSRAPMCEPRNANHSTTTFGNGNGHHDHDDDMDNRDDDRQMLEMISYEIQRSLLSPSTVRTYTNIWRLLIPVSYLGEAQNTTCMMGLKAFLFFFFSEGCAPRSRLLLQFTIGSLQRASSAEMCSRMESRGQRAYPCDVT